MTLTPAHGRDYRNQREVKTDLLAGRDFIIADLFGGNCGLACNIEDLRRDGVSNVLIRYKRLTQVTSVSIKG